jgi:short-subunit dehydrogenase
MNLGKTAIIIGASDGLGKATAEVFVKNKWAVVNISRSPSVIAGGGVTNISCDLESADDIRSAASIVKNLPKFDVVIDCAAIVAMEKVNEISYEKLSKAFKINTIAPFYFLSLLFDDIVRHEADILCVGTTADLKAGFENQLAYTSTKYALRGGSYNIGLELKNTKSRVMYLHTGGMNTRMHEKDYGLKITDPSAWMKPSDVAEIIYYIVNLPKQIEISDITINRKNRRLD